jgi:aspartate/methionine/tyrosine aminotransferase
MDRIQAPIVAVVGEWIRQTPGTISLGQGVVHYGPPAAAVDAVRAGLGAAATHEYQPVAGLPALRERMAAKVAAENGIDLARGSRVMVTAGGNMAFMHAVMATTCPGDEIILPVPFYFNHEMAIEMAGCRAVRVATDDRYQLRLDAIADAVTARTRAIVTISPNNPSGAVLREADLRALNTFCRERGIYHFSDEAYEYFTYGDARHASPGSFPDAAAHTLSLYSLSKAYGFAGWRIGYVV